MPMLLRDLPPAALDAGVRTFGSAAAVAAVLTRTTISELRTLDGALTLRLASLHGDRSVRHLRKSMPGDAYGILRSAALKQGSGVVGDVGANLGYFALTVCRLWPGLRVLAI